MSAPAALLLCSLAGIVLCVVAVFTIAAIAAPRGIVSGPAVAAARGLFASALALIVAAVIAMVWGIGTGWM
ncbi:hypothetical protein [Microbacterium kunmingense]|uniref:hypothetical protein n=1 Tax=Microbacterium kunmingense TaxID=2915939 RepID=UPI00200658E3|nr:hypothetical protein [Microbacterium kunmingense]